MLPVGPPDTTARTAIWSRYLGPHADTVDVAALVQASEMFTPADIEFAARKGAQAAFEREIHHQQAEPASTDAYLAAITDVRPTLTRQAITDFHDDIQHYVRM